MTQTVHELCERAKELTDSEKLELIDELHAQLDHPDPVVDHIWLDEVRKRREAYREGRLETRSYEDILAGFRE